MAAPTRTLPIPANIPPALLIWQPRFSTLWASIRKCGSETGKTDRLHLSTVADHCWNCLAEPKRIRIRSGHGAVFGARCTDIVLLIGHHPVPQDADPFQFHLNLVTRLDAVGGP